MSEGQQISSSDLELTDYMKVAPVSLAQARESAERQAIELALLRQRGRLGDAAQELGISRVTLYRLLTAHGLRTDVNAVPCPVRRQPQPRSNSHQLFAWKRACVRLLTNKLILPVRTENS